MIRKKKASIITFDQNLCNARADDNSILFVRVNDVVTHEEASIVVPPTHTAIIIKGGGDYRYYKSGTYPVFDDKKEKKAWKNGLPVEVVYIPKETRVLIRWGTPNRLKYRDEAGNKVITVGARGEFDVSVSNPEQFFRKVVGAKKEFDLREFSKRFGETVASEFVDVFSKVVSEKHLTYDKFTASKKEIASGIEEILNVQFEKEWGISLRHFLIADFDISDEDMNAIEEFAAEKARQEQMQKIFAELERLDDKQWEREKYLRELELKDRALYYDVLKVIGKREDTARARTEARVLYCPHCGKPYNLTDTFCPACGTKVRREIVKCRHCGSENSDDAEFCFRCGTKLKEEA